MTQQGILVVAAFLADRGAGMSGSTFVCASFLHWFRQHIPGRLAADDEKSGRCWGRAVHRARSACQGGIRQPRNRDRNSRPRRSEDDPASLRSGRGKRTTRARSITHWRKYYPEPGCRQRLTYWFVWRRGSESNRRTRICSRAWGCSQWVEIQMKLHLLAGNTRNPTPRRSH